MPSDSRTVYTSEAGRICPDCGRPVAQCTCKKKKAAPPAGRSPAPAPSIPNDGVVRIFLEKKARGGKTVSVISGLALSDEALHALASELKRRCGTGGTVKERLIEIQGDHRDVLLAELQKRGYKAKKAGG